MAALVENNLYITEAERQKLIEIECSCHDEENPLRQAALFTLRFAEEFGSDLARVLNARSVNVVVLRNQPPENRN